MIKPLQSSKKFKGYMVDRTVSRAGIKGDNKLLLDPEGEFFDYHPGVDLWAGVPVVKNMYVSWGVMTSDYHDNQYMLQDIFTRSIEQMQEQRPYLDYQPYYSSEVGGWDFNINSANFISLVHSNSKRKIIVNSFRQYLTSGKLNDLDMEFATEINREKFVISITEFREAFKD
ncbi:hypothetical protein K7432_007660 [Basidiobolus ranarum]|uniref:Uncharacterized protein n=1 Tax=Basidiobolus ranarum TaxID=34480 RepID=A0ABR2VZR8_9FUNG